MYITKYYYSIDSLHYRRYTLLYYTHTYILPTNCLPQHNNMNFVASLQASDHIRYFRKCLPFLHGASYSLEPLFPDIIRLHNKLRDPFNLLSVLQ